MRSFVSLLCFAALAFSPVGSFAQRLTVPAAPATGGGSPNNQNNTHEFLAFGDGSGTTTTASGVANTKNATWQSLAGPTASDWSSVCLHMWNGASSSAKYLIDFSIDGGSTKLIEDFYIQPNTSGGALRKCFQLNVPAGSSFTYKQQSSAGTGTIRVAIEGIVRNSDHPPGFTRLVHVNGASTSDSRIDGTNVPLTGTWTSLATTAANYGGFYVDVGENGAGATGSAKYITVSLGTGSGTPTTIARFSTPYLTVNPITYLTSGAQIFKTVPSGTDISARVDTTTADSDNVRVGVYGYVP